MSNIQPVWSSQVPAGCEVVNSAKGERDTSVGLAYVQPNTMLAFPSGIEYETPKPRCAWNNYQCEAYLAGSLPLCYGHVQKFLKGNIGELQGEEVQRLYQFKEEFEEFERKRKEAKEAKRNGAKVAPDENDEVIDES